MSQIVARGSCQLEFYNNMLLKYYIRTYYRYSPDVCITTCIFHLTSAHSGNPPLLDDWYDLSYQHISTLGVVVCLLVGTAVSLVTWALGRAGCVSCLRKTPLTQDTYYDVIGTLKNYIKVSEAITAR